MNLYQQRIEPDKQHVTNHQEREFLAGDSKLHDGCALFQVINYHLYCTHIILLKIQRKFNSY